VTLADETLKRSAQNHRSAEYRQELTRKNIVCPKEIWNSQLLNARTRESWRGRGEAKKKLLGINPWIRNWAEGAKAR
jgi:hypothetical protein